MESRKQLFKSPGALSLPVQDLWTLRIAVFALAGMAALILSVQGCSEPQASAQGFTMPPMPVEVAAVKVQKVEDQFEAIGTISASESVVLVSEVNAIVLELPFEEGGPIKAGELIARLDDAQLAAEVTRAEAVRAQSQTTYNRVKFIVDQKAGSPQDLDDAAAALNIAEANLAVAKARFSKTRIVAPFDGIIGARRVSVGSYLSAGEPIAQLANLDNIRVSFSASEGYLAQLTRGGKVTIGTPVYPQHQVTGKIIAIEPILDPATRNGQVVARVPNPGQKLFPGMSVNVSAVLSNRPQALTIPNEAVFANGNQSFVFVVHPDSTVAQVAVTLGSQMTDVVEVVKGLESGNKVVRAGHQKIFHGAKVMPVEHKDAKQ